MASSSRQFKGAKRSIAVASSATATTLDTIYPYEGTEILWLEVSNVTKPLGAFTIEVRSHSDGAFYILANDASDFTTNVQWPIQGCSVDLTSLGSNSTGLVSMDIRAINALRFKAISTAPSTICAIKWEVR